MQKKSLLLLFSLMFVGLASAQFYGTASIGNLLNSVDDSTMVLGAIFLIVFVAVNFSLQKFFSGNRPVAGAIAFAVALLVIWGVNKSGFGYTNIFYGFFFFLPTGFLESIWPLLFIGAWILLIYRNSGIGKGFLFGIRRGTGELFLFSGVLLVFFSFIGALFESGWAVTTGIILIIIGGAVGWLGNKKKVVMQHIQLHRHR